MPTNESGQQQVVAPGNAQQAKAESVVRQLDVLLLGAAKKSIAADIVNNVNTVGETLVKNGVLTDGELPELKTLAKDAAEKMKAHDRFSGREIAKAMKLTKQEIILTGADDSGVIDLDEDNDDQVFETSDARLTFCRNMHLHSATIPQPRANHNSTPTTTQPSFGGLRECRRRIAPRASRGRRRRSGRALAL